MKNVQIILKRMSLIGACPQAFRKAFRERDLLDPSVYWKQSLSTIRKDYGNSTLLDVSYENIKSFKLKRFANGC